MCATNAERAPKERYTYGDYCGWDDGLRWELIDGEPFCMTPGPGAAHQALVVALLLPLAEFLEKEKKCRVFVAPFDVMLPKGDEEEDEIDTVVQPDLMILCDETKLRPNGIHGAPDVVIEILSPSTARRDLAEKLYLYERSGVREYLIVDPDSQIVTVYCRGDENPEKSSTFSRREVCFASDVLEFKTFPDLKIPLKGIFEKVVF